jgi:hypothetical protein
MCHECHGEKAYGLEVSMNNVHAVYQPQAFSDRYKLSPGCVRGWTERREGAWE